MVNNQKQFNEKYPKEIKEIEIKTEDYEDSQEQLIIEDYLELKRLHLYDVQSIEKITLKNLPQLQECTIWDCDTAELIIENCPKIKKLNVRENLLTSLEFLKGLDSLEELEIDGNTEIIKLLEESYGDDWKIYRKNIHELVNLVKDSTKESLQKLLELQGKNNKLSKELELSQQKYENLKNFLKEILVSLSKNKQEELVNELNNEIETREKGTGNFSVYSTEIKTTELTSNLRMTVEEMKELKGKLETKLAESKIRIQELEKELAEAKARAEEREKEIKNISESEIVSQNPVYKEAINFLRTKLVFLNARRGTIEELKERCNDLEKFLNNKSAKFAIIGDAISNVGEAPFVVIPKALGETIKAGNEYSKIKFIAKSSEEFQILLKNEDELLQLDNAYDSLIDFIYKNGGTENSDINVLNLKDKQICGKKHLFSMDCEISAILESKGIWKEKPLNSEAMETAIMSLSENLTKELEGELNQQFGEFKNKLKLGREYTNLFKQEKEVHAKIKQLQSQLGKLINSAKSRLESKKWWDVSEKKEKKNEERQSLLKTFLNDHTSLTNSNKELLEKELSKEGLNSLCQKQKELVELKAELKNLQEKQQTQIQIPPK